MMQMTPETVAEVTAKEISEQLRIPYSTVNHYTDIGLFSVVRRTGNKRMYNRAEVESSFREIARLATEGYPLLLIRRKMLGLVKHELL